MSESERDLLAAWVDERLEAYIDGDLDESERERVASFVAADDSAAAHLEAARRVRDYLRTSPRPAAPAVLTRAVLDRARRDAVRSKRDRAAMPPARAARTADLWARWIRPTVMTSLFILVVTASVLVRRPVDPPPVTSSAEVEQALADVKWTLAFVTGVGRRTGRSIRREVIEERVSEPVQRALDEALRQSRTPSLGEEPRS